jgi:hypothetical protein
MVHLLRVPEIPSPAPHPPPVPHLEPPRVYVPGTWEYHHLRKTPGQAIDEQELNPLGAAGWELVGVLTEPDGVHLRRGARHAGRRVRWAPKPRGAHQAPCP